MTRHLRQEEEETATVEEQKCVVGGHREIKPCLIENEERNSGSGRE